MSDNEEWRCVVCFALPPALIAGAVFASVVCKLQSRFTSTPRVRIRSTYCGVERKSRLLTLDPQ